MYVANESSETFHVIQVKQSKFHKNFKQVCK